MSVEFEHKLVAHHWLTCSAGFKCGKHLDAVRAEIKLFCAQPYNEETHWVYGCRCKGKSVDK